MIITIINYNAYTSIPPISPSASGEHTYTPKKAGIFSVKIVKNYDVFFITKIRLGEISSRKKQFC